MKGTARKIFKLFVIVTLAVAAFTVYFLLYSNANAEEETAYVFCVDYVNVRQFPSKKGEEIGRFETGDVVHLDGKKRNGFLHCVDTGLESDGWIHAGFIVYDEPEHVNQKATVVSKGRLAARKYIGGKRTRWLKPLSTVTVYYWSEDWAITNCGYVQSKHLELEGE